MDIKNKQHLIEKLDKGEEFEYLFFWDFVPRQEGILDESCLSQWYPSPFTINIPVPGELVEITIPTAEHYMMFKKANLFYDYANANKILHTKTPKEAKKIGREVKNFDADKWETEAFEIVLTASINKFFSGEMREFLLLTGNRILVKASPDDIIWGIGLEANDPRAKDPKAWPGKNGLGFALMKAREMLKEDNVEILSEYWGWKKR